MNTNYKRIEQAIGYLLENFRSQPSLDQVASHLNLSPFHFQRIFTEWAGISPKQFLRFISVEHAKKLLRKEKTLFEVSHETGLSGTGRLHDLFVTIEAMTPGEFKNGGDNLAILFSYSETPYGEILIGSTGKGICHIAFTDDKREESVKKLISQFPNASYKQKKVPDHLKVLSHFGDSNKMSSDDITLHIKGTPFQLKVWEALLKVPEGELTSYSGIADQADNPKASRAAGSAIGKNPVAYLIPCHRVIRSTGVIGSYRWGSSRKRAMIGREAVLRNRIRQDN